MNVKGLFHLVKFHNYNAFILGGTIFERTCTKGERPGPRSQTPGARVPGLSRGGYSIKLT